MYGDNYRRPRVPSHFFNHVSKPTGLYPGMFDNTSVPHLLTILGDITIVYPAPSVTLGSLSSSSPHVGPHTPVGCVEMLFMSRATLQCTECGLYVEVGFGGNAVSGVPLRIVELSPVLLGLYGLVREPELPACSWRI